MKKDDRRDLFRKVVGAILASSLDQRQIEMLGEDLIDNERVGGELGVALLAALESLCFDPNRGGKLLASNQGFESEQDAIVATMIGSLTRLRLSKRDLVSLVVKQHILDYSTATLMRLSVGEILNRIIQNPNKKKAEWLKNYLSRGVDPDPYLTGIERR